MFRVASVSKTFAAQLAAIEVRGGRLDWDEPLSHFAPDFRLKDGAHQPIRLRHVLGQSSGLVPNAFDNLVDDSAAGEDPAAIPHAVADLHDWPLPRLQNILFAQSARAIEAASGMEYGDRLRQQLLAPLQMHHASVGMSAFLASRNRAEPHLRRDGNWQRIDVEPNYYQLPAAAGVNASINDLAIWVLAQLGNNPDMVAAADVRTTLTTPRVATPKELRRGGWKDFSRSRPLRHGLADLPHRRRIARPARRLGLGFHGGGQLFTEPRDWPGTAMNAESGSAMSEAGSSFWRHQLGIPVAVPEDGARRSAPR